MLAAAALLHLTPTLNAQSSDKAPVAASATKAESGARLYTVKFDGGTITELCSLLREAFPKDNLVVSNAGQRIELPAFELRNVRLAEIGRTMEFLCEGQLSVEVVEMDGDTSGNIWRIGRKNPADTAASTKMRSVAAPNLFAPKERLEAILKAAEEMEMERVRSSVKLGNGALSSGFAKVTPLESQKVFVCIGGEAGVAGLESFIKAAEQQIMDTTAAQEALIAANKPKMRAVLAPHLFAEESRWKALTQEMKQTIETLMMANENLRASTDSPGLRPQPMGIQPRDSQKIFILIGSEDDIKGMESMIQSAEKLAAEEDSIIATIKAEERARAGKNDK
jgi:hypothetical protein